MPKSIKTFLGLTYAIIGLSVLALLLSWIFFQSYSEFYIKTHGSSFDSLPSQQFKVNTVVFILVIRSAFSLGWISSLIYMRRLVRARNRHLLVIISVYAVISFVGYGILVFQNAMLWQTVIRGAQALAGAGLLVLVLSQRARRSIKKYVDDPD